MDIKNLLVYNDLKEINNIISNKLYMAKFVNSTFKYDIAEIVFNKNYSKINDFRDIIFIEFLPSGKICIINGNFMFKHFGIRSDDQIVSKTELIERIAFFRELIEMTIINDLIMLN